MNSADLGTLIKRCSLSREQVAERLDVTTHTINNWCTHRTPISPHHLEALGMMLWQAGIPQQEVSSFVLRELEHQGLSPDTVLGGREEPRTESPDQTGRRGLVPVLTWSAKSGSPSRDYGTETQRALEDLGFQSYVIDCAENHRFKRSTINHVLNLNIAGVALAVPGEMPGPEQELEEIAWAFAERHRPSILIQYPCDTARLPAISGRIAFTSAWGVRRAVELLTIHGHRRIGGVFRPREQTSPLPLSPKSMLEDALHDAGIDPAEASTLVPDNEFQTQDIARLVSSSTAVYVGNSEHLLWLAQGLHRLGLSWPEDISIIAVAYNKTVLQLGPRPFTYLDVPIREIAQDGAKLLLRLVSGEKLSIAERTLTDRSTQLLLVNKDGGSIGPPRQAEPGSLSVGLAQKYAELHSST